MTECLMTQHLSIRENSKGDLRAYATNEEFMDKFEKYMKVAKRCNASNLSDCFPEKFYDGEGDERLLSDFTTGSSLGHSTYTAPLVGFRMANGTSVIMATDPNCEFKEQFSNVGSNTDCVAMVSMQRHFPAIPGLFPVGRFSRQFHFRVNQ